MHDKIKRRDFLGLMGAGFAASAVSGCKKAQESTEQVLEKTAGERPNILWISVEDISCDLGCYGNEELSTPNIDRLAAQGALYTKAFTTSPVCAPCRSGIITCMYPTSIGTMHMRTGNKGYEGVPPPYAKCFTEYLRAAGYYCTNRAKTDYQFNSPITAWDRNGGKHDDWSGRAEGRPFFSVINHHITHESMIRTPPDKNPLIDPESVTIPPYYPDTPVVRRDWARYLDNIESLDKQVGELLTRLERDNLAENTVVFFWSDHGRGLPRAKRWPYDSGTHVPLIVRWPGVIEPGTVCDDLISSIDLGPTVLSIAGVEIPAYMQGQPFQSGQKASAAREYVFSHRDRMDETYDMVRSVRDKRFRFIRNFQPEKPYGQPISYMDLMPTMKEWRRLADEGRLEGPQKLFFQETKPALELYDTDSDPYEIDNLAFDPEYKGVVSRMSEALEDWMNKTGDLGNIPEDELIEMIRPGGVQPETAEPVITRVGGPAAGGAVRVGITCSTEGASIAYTTESWEKPHWLLYTGELELDRGTHLRARAIRIGYKESPEARY